MTLKGLWEVCRHDEALPGEVAEPITDFPAEPRWKAIEVPGDKNEQRPDLLFAHRLWYRTRVNVPAALAGRSFFLTFPQNNLNTTVFVNGVYCGFNKNPFVHFDIDVTKGIKPGQVNEIWVGIRDAWYAYSTKPGDPMKLRKKFNLPPDFARMGFQDLAYPVWGAWQSGILVTPTLTAAGPAYASRRVRQAVGGEEAAGGRGDGRQPVRPASRPARSLCEAVDPTDRAGGEGAAGQAVHRRRPARSRWSRSTGDVGRPEALVAGRPAPVRRCAPPSRVDGKPVDVARHARSASASGAADGKNFTLNGVRLARLEHGRQRQHDPDEWLAYYRKTHQTHDAALRRHPGRPPAVLRHVARTRRSTGWTATASRSAAAASSTARPSATWPIENDPELQEALRLRRSRWS